MSKPGVEVNTLRHILSQGVSAWASRPNGNVDDNGRSRPNNACDAHSACNSIGISAIGIYEPPWLLGNDWFEGGPIS